MDNNLLLDIVHSLEKLANLKRYSVIYGLGLFLILLISAVYLVSLSPFRASAQTQFVKAEVLSVSPSHTIGNQNVKVKVLDGAEKGKVATLQRSYFIDDPNSKRLPVGSIALLTIQPKNGNQFSFLDRYRLTGALTLILILTILVLVIGRFRGMSAAVGLVFTIAILSTFVLPRIIKGDPAFATCIEGAFMVAAITIFIAHGFRRRTAVAFISTLITLVLIVGISAAAVYMTGVTGNAGETINSEQSVPLIEYAPHYINITGLFLGGMVIASLGVLEDITTSQAAAVDELHKANPKLGTVEIYKKGLSVGREHIAALINTLAILYAGTALPTIVVTILNNTGQSLAVSLNDETIVEAIVRTAVPSIGLLLAVPLSTALAAYILPRWYKPSRAHVS